MKSDFDQLIFIISGIFNMIEKIILKFYLKFDAGRTRPGTKICLPVDVAKYYEIECIYLRLKLLKLFDKRVLKFVS